MSYRGNERKKAIEIRDEVFRDPGAGVFFEKEREFVLQDPKLNLWAGIRDDVIKYFERNHVNTDEVVSGIDGEDDGYL